MRSAEAMSAAIPRNVISMETWKANRAPFAQINKIELAAPVEPPFFPEMPTERSYLRKDERFNTAIHELKHHELILFLNEETDVLSANPLGDNILGFTRPKGHINPSKMQIVAAGGTHESALGGGGMDWVNVRVLEPYGIPAESAHKSADNRLGKVNDEFHAKAAEIILFLGGTVDGETLKKIYIRVRWEMQQASKQKNVEAPQQDIELSEAPRFESKIYTYHDENGQLISEIRTIKSDIDSQQRIPHHTRRGVMVEPLAA